MSSKTFSYPTDPFSPAELKNEKLKKEIQLIEAELKDWFISRKILMERNISIKKMLDKNNFMGLSINNKETPDTLRVLWTDLVDGKPELEDNLSLDARQVKADMYMNIFKKSTDIENSCRIPGVHYLRCLRNNYEKSCEDRSNICFNGFSSFNACRNALKQKQAAAFNNALMIQQLNDNRAKTLFERRNILLDMIIGRA